MKNDTDERNRLGREVVTGGIKCNTENVICVLPDVCVSAVCHYVLIVLLEICKRLCCECLCILAVVRLILIKVRVECMTESGYGNAVNVLVLV